VLPGELREAIGVERIELLDPDDRGIGDVVFLAILDEIVVDLAGAEQEAGGLFRT